MTEKSEMKKKNKATKATYKVHPGIGIARVGDSPKSFCIASETPGGLPIRCDQKTGRAIVDRHGNEKTVRKFKDRKCRIKRQAARFKIFVYDGENSEGTELKRGDTIYGPGSHGNLVESV